jgi:cysteine desulfurase family protein
MAIDIRNLIYFDNAATSWPKPPQVLEAMTRYLTGVGGSPGRSGHRMSIEASRIVSDARDSVAQLFGIDDPGRIAFTKNSTEALNIAIQGWVRPGDHVITSSIEHNSVMRPLRYMEQQGMITLSVVPCSAVTGCLDLRDVSKALNPKTRLIVMLHGSNVIGNVLPLKEIGAIARTAGIPLLVDASQTAGAYPIDVRDLNIDMLAFTGHKSMLGPTGTGGLYISEGYEFAPLTRGGTGSKSEQEVQPDFMPDKYEAGTMNVVGLAGLGAGVDYLLNTGVETVLVHERSLVRRFLDGAASIRGVRVVGPADVEQRTGVISFLIDGVTTSKTGLLLDQSYGIMSRIGLHCAPAAHRTLGTFPDGTVRFGFSYFNTPEQVDRALVAVEEISTEAKR